MYVFVVLYQITNRVEQVCGMGGHQPGDTFGEGNTYEKPMKFQFSLANHRCSINSW